MNTFSCRGLIEMFIFGPSIYAVFAFNKRYTGVTDNATAARSVYACRRRVRDEKSPDAAFCCEPGLSSEFNVYRLGLTGHGFATQAASFRVAA